MNPRFQVRLHCDPVWFMHKPVLAGLFTLSYQGLIDLRLVTRRLPREKAMWIEVSDEETTQSRTICIDLSDQHHLQSPMRTALADSLWKRSYSGGVGRPLGLFAFMGSKHDQAIKHSVKATWASLLSGRPSDLRLCMPSQFGKFPLIDDYLAPAGGQQKILFQVKAWDPASGEDPEDRHRVNEGRAQIIKRMRGAFGERFVGGFVPSEFAVRAYPSLLTDQSTSRADYFRLVRSCNIGLSSVGLHGSNPEKTVELMAASRVLVSEPLRALIPEPIDGIAHFFQDLDSLVEICDQLLASDLTEQQKESRRYFDSFVRPDVLLHRRMVEEFSG